MRRAICLWRLTLSAVFAGALSAGCGEPADRSDPAASASIHVHGAPQVTPDEAFARLREGNRRFVAGRARHPHESRSWRQELEGGQHPFAIVLGCSDSRVPPELLFDQGFGDLFVIRVAGNIIDDDVIGSVEYAVGHLDTPLVAVLGHECCGAVTAAISAAENIDSEPPELAWLLHHMQARLSDDAAGRPIERRVQLCVESNARWVAERLRDKPLLGEAISAGKLRVIAGVYELQGGNVRWLDVP